MKGFKNSTKTSYSSGPSACGKNLRGAAQVSKTMAHYKCGGSVKGRSKKP